MSRAATCLIIIGFRLLPAMEAWAQAPAGESVRPVFAHPIPNIPGKRLSAVEVTYVPGGRSPAHTHAPSAFIFAYVVSGAIRSQVGSEPAPSNIESGQRRIDVVELLDLAEAVGFDPCELVQRLQETGRE